MSDWVALAPFNENLFSIRIDTNYVSLPCSIKFALVASFSVFALFKRSLKKYPMSNLSTFGRCHSFKTSRVLFYVHNESDEITNNTFWNKMMESPLDSYRGCCCISLQKMIVWRCYRQHLGEMLLKEVKTDNRFICPLFHLTCVM